MKSENLVFKYLIEMQMSQRQANASSFNPHCYIRIRNYGSPEFNKGYYEQIGKQIVTKEVSPMGLPWDHQLTFGGHPTVELDIQR